MAEPTLLREPVVALRPGDLKFAPGRTAPKRLRCRLLAVDVRRTQQGQSWAWLDLSWRGRTIRGAVFPSQWQTLRAVPHLVVGGDYVVIGSVSFRDGTPALQVHEVHEQVLRLVASDGVGVGGGR